MINHYTNINALKCILESKKIRFNRLDRVDDRTEGESFQKIPFAKYLFVSSWASENYESIPQWLMYGDNYHGVRISLPEEMFQKKDFFESIHEPNYYKYFSVSVKKKHIFNIDDLFGDGYFIIPSFMNDEEFIHRIKYTTEIFNIKKELEEIKINGSNFQLIISGLNKMVGFKDIHWNFQNEVRFALQVYPYPKIPPEGLSNKLFRERAIKYMLNNMLIGKEIPLKYIDIPLEEEIINNIKITIGPKCNDVEREQIFTLTSELVKKATISNSELTNILVTPNRS